MAKRFTDTDIWRQSWFVELSPQSKLIWFYLTAKCDTAGIWDIDIPMMRRQIGDKNISLLIFLEEVNRDYVPGTEEPIKRNRVMRIANGSKLWLTGFISFQYEKGRRGVNPVIPAIKGALNRLRDENIFEFAVKEGFVRIKCPDIISDSEFNSINKIPAAAAAGEAKGWQPFARDKDKDKDQDLEVFVLKDLKRGECEGGEVHREAPGGAACEAGMNLGRTELHLERVRGKPSEAGMNLRRTELHLERVRGKPSEAEEVDLERVRGRASEAEVVGLERKREKPGIDLGLMFWALKAIPDKAELVFILVWYKPGLNGEKLLHKNNLIFVWQKKAFLQLNSRGSPLSLGVL